MAVELVVTPEQTIHGVGQAIRDGRTSCVAVLKACLERLDACEPRIRAWVRVDRDGAEARARELDADLAAGRWHGPLHGIPLGIKDIVDVAGLPTAAGSRLLGDRPAQQDAPLVARLRAAGAVVLGKTVTTQFASFDPPITRNPWNTAQTPGGSSSGSAAAVACGMCLGAVGSQTGGSITRPASYCGVAGCKPTFGRVGTQGVMPLAPSLDHPGPIARSVGDLAILLDVMAGGEGGPPMAVGAALDARPLSPPKLGRLRDLFDERAERSARTALDAALDVWTAAGASVTEARLPDSFDGVLPSHRVLMAVEAAAFHEHRLAAHADDYLPAIRSLIEEGMAVSAPEYVRCRQHQAQSKREILPVFDGVDVLVCPATPGPAPDTSTTGDPVFNSPWSYLGLPTVSFPIGLSDDDLPLAVQLVGRPWNEQDLFRAALWCEEHLASVV